MAHHTLGTIAEYYRLGLHVGLLLPEHASGWADSVVAAMVSPPMEVIEVSWSRGPHAMIGALSAVGGGRDRQLAGSWLLGLLRESLPESEDGLQVALRRATQIAREAGLDEDICCRLDVLEDELSLARTGIYGTVQQCRADALRVLADLPTIDVPCGPGRNG